MDDEDIDDDDAHNDEDDEPELGFNKKTYMDRPDYTRRKTWKPDLTRHGHYCCQLFLLTYSVVNQITSFLLAGSWKSFLIEINRLARKALSFSTRSDILTKK